MRDGDQGFGIVIRALGGIEDAQTVQAEAGDPIAYDTANLTRTTDGGTFRNGDGTWQDNDLGAARSDGEDFLTHTWTLVGSVEGGASGAALGGTDTTADRPDIIVGVNMGTRSVNDVNKIVDIQDSGLQTTTDVATWQVAVSEDITGEDGGTDTVEVSYTNADPVIDAALATPVGNDIQFDLAFHDDDEDAVNALIADFELLEVAIFSGATDRTASFADLIANGTQTLTQGQLLALFGPGPDSIKIIVTDRVARRDGTMVMTTVDFDVVPEPAVAWLALLALGVLAHRRRA